MRLFLLLLSGMALSGQSTPPPAPAALPTYVGWGVTFNQIATPKFNLWFTAIYPVVSSLGVYSSTSTDIVPVQKTDATSGKAYWAFSTSIRQGVHKTIFSRGKFTALLGGDAGVALSQAQPSGLNVGLSTSFTATAVYQLGKGWSLVLPVRGMWINSSWNLVPEIGVLFNP